VAHFLLELLVRLRQRGLADENMFWFPLAIMYLTKKTPHFV